MKYKHVKDLFNYYMYLTKSVYDVDTPRSPLRVCVLSAALVGH